MMSPNGIPCVRIGRKGIRAFGFGDDPEFKIDVIQVYNEWNEIQQQLLDEELLKQGQRKIKNNKAYSDALTAFVYALKVQSGGGEGPISYAEASEFIANVIEIQAELAAFFDLTRRGKLSSLAPSGSPASGSTPGRENSSGPASNEQPLGTISTTYEVEPQS